MAVGGIGAALWLSHAAPSLAWFQPLHGAIVAALIGAVVIGLVHQRVAERMDTLIGAMWAVGMSVGLLFIKFTPGYHVELMSYLFGNIAYVSRGQLAMTAVLTLVVVGAVVLMYKRFLAICLDEEQAALQGIDVPTTNTLLLCLVALAVICLTQVVGLILVIALLTLPAATAAYYFRRMGAVMAATALLCMALTTLPRIAVYGTPVSPECAIVLAAAAVYLASAFGRRFLKPRVC
jgi:zinc transport system permease protein